MEVHHLRQLAIFLTNLNDGSADWGKIAHERQVTLKGNAQRDFKVMIRRYGLDYANNKFTPIPGFNAGGTITASPATGKKPSTPRKRKSEAGNGDDKEKGESPAKKARAKKTPKPTDDTGYEESVKGEQD